MGFGRDYINLREMFDARIRAKSKGGRALRSRSA
jgi:hypothetical protein